MSSRLLSSNTLMEGIEGVEFKGPSSTSDRKRQLQEQIQAGYHAAYIICIAFGENIVNHVYTPLCFT